MNIGRTVHAAALSLTNRKLKSLELLHEWWEKCKATVYCHLINSASPVQLGLRSCTHDAADDKCTEAVHQLEL